MKQGFVKNIEELTLSNNSFRKVLYTGPYSQLVLMSLAPGEEIGEEVHGNDQFFRIESGTGEIIIGDSTTAVAEEWAAIVPAGTRHNVINTGSEYLKLYTLYSIPHHKNGIEHITKADAEQDSEEFDGVLSE